MNAVDQPHETGYRCEGGPLHGERHDEGATFEFDGRPLGLESGVYRLLGEVYSWEPAGPESLEIHLPPADE